MSHNWEDRTQIKIKANTPQGYAFIKGADFNEKEHELYKETKAEKAEAKAKAEGPKTTVKPGFDGTKIVKKDVVDRLSAAGYGDPVAISNATVEQLTAVEGVGQRVADALQEEARKYIVVTDGE